MTDNGENIELLMIELNAEIKQESKIIIREDSKAAESMQ